MVRLIAPFRCIRGSRIVQPLAQQFKIINMQRAQFANHLHFRMLPSGNLRAPEARTHLQQYAAKDR